MSLRIGFSILRECWQVLKADSEPMWFPVMSRIAAMLVLVAIVGAVFSCPQSDLGRSKCWTDG